MAKILKIDSGMVHIGFADGKLKEYPFDKFNFVPLVGDEVDVFESDNGEVVISKNVQATAQANPNAKSKLVAGLLGIFLGGWGIHNFYLGKTGKGIAQVLLGTIGIFFFFLGPVISGIWGLVEGIMILTSKTGSPWHQDENGNELTD